MPEFPRIPPAARLDRHTNTPLWRQLAADLRDRLDGGEFTEGFPGEVELGLQYSVGTRSARRCASCAPTA